MIARTAVVACTAAFIAAGLMPWWLVWPIAVVLLSAIMLYEDAPITRYAGQGRDADAWGMLQAAGLIEQALSATLAAGAGLVAKLAAAFVA